MGDILKSKNRNIILIFVTLGVQAFIYTLSGSFFDFLGTPAPALSIMTIIAGLSIGFLFNGLSTVFPLLAFIFAFFGKNSISKVAFVLGLISGIIGLLWFVFGIVTFIAAIGVGNNPANAIAFLMFGFGHLTSIITLALIKWSKI